PLPTLRNLKRHFIGNTNRLVFADLLIRQIMTSPACVRGLGLSLNKWAFGVPDAVLARTVRDICS
ncbi:MAG: hypothetical protein KH902_12265, partial [Subdoligranulum variabile]|nr:hypothetical protein [Subdoligranulum variabile]